MLEVVTNTGTEVKVSVGLQCGSVGMDDFDFVCKFYTSPSKMVEVRKSDMTRESESSYIAVVDTEGMASGTIRMRVEAEIPDTDCADGLRTEVATADTGIMVKH